MDEERGEKNQIKRQRREQVNQTKNKSGKMRERER